MKSSDQWAVIIINYLQKNPVKTMAEATAQIKHVVEAVQDDAQVISIPANDSGPDTAA